MLKPIIKFNNGNGAILCNKCSVIIKSNLTKEEFDGRTHLLFCDEHWKEYQNATEEPQWVCFRCAEDRGATMPKGHVATCHPDTCGICQKENVSCTEPRDFGVHRNRLRIPR